MEIPFELASGPPKMLLDLEFELGKIQLLQVCVGMEAHWIAHLCPIKGDGRLSAPMRASQCWSTRV